ncbi:MAG: PEGA domain-containing protein [Cytophagaceae bacterium]|nr:MAG: PEGA domain-containing protein [Cytophagaceae bacterium]
MHLKNTFRKSFVALCAVSMLSLQSCATLFTGTRDTIHFESQPSGAKVRMDGLDMGRTPLDLNVKRSLNDKVVNMSLDGYETRNFSLSKEFNAVSILNLFGLLGWAVDAATGSLMKYDMKAYTIELDPKKPVGSGN